LQRATEFALGLWAFFTDEPMDESWGDAVAATREEGAELAYDANVLRASLRNRRKDMGA